MLLGLEMPPEFIESIRKAVREEVLSIVQESVLEKEDQLMTIKEISEFMKVTTSTVRKFMNSGMPHFKEGYVIRFVKSDVIKWAKNRSDLFEEEKGEMS